MKKKNNIFLSLMALFTILVAVLIYSCGKNASSSIDTPNNEANQNSKFAANEWPVFAISRAQLSNFIQVDCPVPSHGGYGGLGLLSPDSSSIVLPLDCKGVPFLSYNVNLKDR